MRRLILLLLPLLCCFLITPALAAPEDLYGYDQLTLGLTLKNTVTIVPQTSQTNVDYVTAGLAWWPRETYRQHVAEIGTIPKAEQTGDVYLFSWQHPKTTALNYELRANVMTSDEALPVHEKIPFPIPNVPSDVAQYTEHSKLIDTDADIRREALKLADGKDDLFEVVYTVADWVTMNIAYNLTSVTADATKPATWVYANRQGVCDELTALFISMLRELGIPARFVSGLSYTNLPEFAEPWGGHGWAEVWFPDVGWVPFDPTYGTYGYVDATHIKLLDSVDAGSPSVDYTMSAFSASMMTRSLETDVQVLGKKKVRRKRFAVTLKPFDDTALDSYNLLTAQVTNLQDEYASARFTLSKTEGLELIGDPDQNVLLKPRETKELRYLVRTTGLHFGFWYELPVKLYIGLHEVANTSFVAREGNPSYDKQLFDTYVATTATEQPYDAQADLSCTAQPEAAYVNGTLEGVCTLENDGGLRLGSVKICAQECVYRDVLPGGSATYAFPLDCSSPGAKTLLVTAKNGVVSKQAILKYRCLDHAAAAIVDLEHPEMLGFNESGPIAFAVRKTSEAVPINVTVAIAHDNFFQKWTSDDLAQPQRFTYTIMGQNLDLSGNDVNITVTYSDQLGTPGETSETFTVEPRGFTFLQKLQVDLLNLQRWIDAKLG